MSTSIPDWELYSACSVCPVDLTVPTDPSRASGSDSTAGRAPLDTAALNAAARRRRQIHHDLHHELGTVMMLASALDVAEDIGPESRERVRQILRETRWLRQLVGAFENSFTDGDEPPAAANGPVRIDRCAAEVVQAIQMSTSARIHLHAEPAAARVEPLASWRALRNIVVNAVRAAGPGGRVEVRVRPVDGWALVEVDDDGPGFGAIAPGPGSLGLGIVQDVVAAAGGDLEIRHGVLGGCCVLLGLPTAPRASTSDLGEERCG